MSLEAMSEKDKLVFLFQETTSALTRAYECVTSARARIVDLQTSSMYMENASAEEMASFESKLNACLAFIDEFNKK